MSRPAVVLATLLAAGSGALLAGGNPVGRQRVRRLVRTRHPTRVTLSGATLRRSSSGAPPAAQLVAVGTVGCVGLLVWAWGVALTTLALAGGLALAAGLRAHRRDARARLTRELVAELCRATAAELHAGRIPAHALAAAAESLAPARARATAGAGTAPAQLASAVLAPLVAAARSGGDVAAELRRAASQPGAGALRWLGACWQVAEGSGAALADACGRVADALGAEDAVRREVAAQLAGPRATARLLVLLPAIGVLLGRGLGADPVSWLRDTGAGRSVLALAVLLVLVGQLWTRRLLRSAEPP